MVLMKSSGRVMMDVIVSPRNYIPFVWNRVDPLGRDCAYKLCPVC